MFVNDLFNKKKSTKSTKSPGVSDHYVRQVDEGRGFRGVGGARSREDDERSDLDPTDWYVVKDGKMFSVSVYPRQVAQAEAQGFSRTKEQARARAGSQGVAEGSLNEFAPDGFNGGDDGEEFNPRLAKMAYDEGIVKGASLADGATLERAMAINDWDKHDGGIYKQHFAKGFKAGRMDKIRHNNKQYNLNLKLMKDGSIRHGEQGVAEGISVVDQDYDLDQIILTLNIEGKKVSFTYWDYDENFANAERKDVFDQLQKQPWYARLDHPTRMEILDAAYRAIRGLEPQEYRPTVRDEPLDEQGVAEAGPFSYGAKKSKKGSVADLAAKKRRDQEQGRQPIEPKDQQVGVARVIKDVAEGFSDIVKGVKRKVAGKTDPKEVEKDYAVKARREIGDANRYNNPAAYADRDKAVRRYNKVAKVVNKEDVDEGAETHKYQVVVKGHKRSYSVWVDAKNEDVAIIRAQQYVAQEHSDKAKHAAVVDMKQGVAEGLKFHGGFPDVDHMPGAVYKNGDRPKGMEQSQTSKRFFSDKAAWDQAVNEFNSTVFDDNSEFTGSNGIQEVEANGHVWAKWSDKRNKGFIDMGTMSEGVAASQTDYQKRRQRERDVDAGRPVKPQPRNPQNDYFARRKKEKDLAEGHDDTVAFELDSENAYNHVTDKFGSVIDWDGDIMVAPRKYWGAIQELAYAAGGEATEAGNEQDVDEAKHFRTSYGWSGGRNEKTGRTYKHPDQIKADKAAKKSGISKDAETQFHSKLDSLVHDTFGKRKSEMEEGSTQDRLHRRHQELRKKSGLPDPNYYKELRATYDLPDEERYVKAAELRKKYKVSEAGPFGYGAREPKKGSVADLAAQKRKEQERSQLPIEPRDQRVGNAKVTNEDVDRYVEELSRAGYEMTEEKVRLDPKCWKGKKIGDPKTKVKGGVRVNNCVPK